MKIRKWKSPMTVGNEKLFKCANYFGHIKTHKRSSRQGAMLWRGEGSAAAAAGQTEWSERFFNFETTSQHAKQWREILSFFFGFCESKSLQFKAFFCLCSNKLWIFAALTPEAQSGRCDPVPAPRGHPYVNPGLLEPGCVLCVTPNWRNFRDTFTIFALILTSGDPGTGQRWQGVSERASDQWATAAQPPIGIWVCVLAAQRTAGVTKVWKCVTAAMNWLDSPARGHFPVGVADWDSGRAEFGAHFELSQLPKLGI